MKIEILFVIPIVLTLLGSVSFIGHSVLAQDDNQGSDRQGSENDQRQKICDPINGNPYAKECGGTWESHPGPSGGTVLCKPQKVYPGVGGTGCVHISP